MADDTSQSGTDVIATDHVTTLNGVAVVQSATTPKVPRNKVTFGDDGTSRDVSAAFPLPVRDIRSSTAAATTASIATASATVLLANVNRLGATVYNESGATLYLHMGATASLTAYVLQVAIGGYYEVPFGYTGVLSGITAAATAVVRVVEVT